MEIQRNLFRITSQMNIQLSQENTVPNSSIVATNKSNQKGVRISSKRKLLISPSKGLLVFFGSTTFNNLNSNKCNKKQTKNKRLKLDRKQHQQIQRCPQINATNQVTKQKKALSLTNFTQSFNSHKTINVEQQKFQKLKKQVDQIRRKYSYDKLKQSSKINSQQVFRNSRQNNSLSSLNSSKQKKRLLTPKRDIYLGRRILTKNMFSEKSTNLRINANQNTRTLKISNLLGDQSKRKCSFQLQDMASSVDLKYQIQGVSGIKTFQFTFGSMAMMDYQNKQKLQPRNC